MLTGSTAHMKQSKKTGSCVVNSQSLPPPPVVYFLEQGWTSSPNHTTWGDSVQIHKLVGPFSLKPPQTTKTNSESLVFKPVRCCQLLTCALDIIIYYTSLGTLIVK